jgi:endonuclease/exonuclease/phosphatase (EEP) superfamily protein YafD
MDVFFLIFSILLILISVLPFIKNQHWVFRASEFVKIQLIVLQLAATAGLLIFAETNAWFWIVFSVQTSLLLYHSILLIHYTRFFKRKHHGGENLKNIKIISANIYQFNQEFDRFKELIRKQDPVIFVTMESNKDWEIALRELENDYPHTQKVTLENTYGMHLYSKIPFEKIKTHYFVADDVPSMEAHFQTEAGEGFVLFCVHPPPPSPTEEETSKERDGDLLSITKLAKRMEKPTLVMGDFNSVAWSNISRLFRKNSGLIDGRKGRGILASFHAKYWFLRAPLDLVFHSCEVFINELKILEYIGSDHFPISCVFCINKQNSSQEDEVEDISQDELAETDALIEEGKKEESDNRMMV